MAITIYIPNHFKYQMGKRAIKFDSDVFKCILMQNSFSFNVDTHSTLADVSGSELAAGNGYLTGGYVIGRHIHPDLLSAYKWYRSDATNSSFMKFFKITWEAVGGSIGPLQAAIIYDDTIFDNSIICCVQLSVAVTATIGYGITIGDITIALV